ncbi:MAG: hypothetical protein QF535_18870 [Anaerolineales bacterium]|nr:hypothetical protein [Anaerolineales bacterium]
MKTDWFAHIFPNPELDKQKPVVALKISNELEARSKVKAKQGPVLEVFDIHLADDGKPYTFTMICPVDMSLDEVRQSAKNQFCRYSHIEVKERG